MQTIKSIDKTEFKDLINADVAEFSLDKIISEYSGICKDGTCEFTFPLKKIDGYKTPETFKIKDNKDEL